MIKGWALIKLNRFVTRQAWFLPHFAMKLVFMFVFVTVNAKPGCPMWKDILTGSLTLSFDGKKIYGVKTIVDSK